MSRYSQKRSALDELCITHEARPLFDLPKETLISNRTGLFIAGGLIATAVIASTAVVTSIIAGGTLLFAGFVAVSETNKYVKWLVERGDKIVDLILFATGVVLIMKSGVVIAGAFSVFGFLYTTQYAPRVRRQYRKRKQFD